MVNLFLCGSDIIPYGLWTGPDLPSSHRRVVRQLVALRQVHFSLRMSHHIK